MDLHKADSIVPPYIDVEAETGRVTLALPGPREDAAYPSYEITIRTNRVVRIADGIVSVQIKGERNQSKRVSLIESKEKDASNGETNSRFLLYGICPLGEVDHDGGVTTMDGCHF